MGLTMKPRELIKSKLSIVCSKQSNGSFFAICPEIKGCFTQEDLQDIISSQTKIFSEFEIAL